MSHGSRERVVWIDAVAGASGDMLLGALVHAGVPVEVLRGAVAALPLSGWTLEARRVIRGGVAATKVDVSVSGGPPDAHVVRPADGPGPFHDEHHGRSRREILEILDGGSLAAPVRDRATKVFDRLFEAEARAHGLDVDAVHLHEAGATDAVVDIVGTCAGIVHLAPDRVIVSPVTTGWGTVECAHGTYPVPGPATAYLLRGVPLSGVDAKGERLTPTGAALLTTLATGWGALPAMVPTAVGYGAGTRDFPERPNCVRLIVGEAEAGSRSLPGEGDVLVVECTIDDATPQALAYALERALAAGALEAFTTPVVMKKGRAGHLLTLLARPERFEAVTESVLRETTTIGVRFRREGRVELERSVTAVQTAYGPIRVKAAGRDGVAWHAWPEYEDCAEAARRSGASLLDVQQAALAAFRGTGKDAR
ncbi:MAG TPA: nickel pincer cofactor biosynthesis protein LarC [Candidatus Polarisedimenticolaceae bacterium]